jgi:hypothetical protein
MFALRWITDQIIRSQPGSYVLPHPEGGDLWVCPYGSGKSPHRIEGGTGTVEASQFVDVTSVDGVTRKYEVVVSIREVPDERGEAGYIDEASDELPVANGPERTHSGADPEAEPQGS